MPPPHAELVERGDETAVALWAEGQVADVILCWPDLEGGKGRLDFGALQPLRDKDELRNPVLGRPVGECLRLGDDVLHRMDDDRCAVDIDEPLHPQEFWPAEAAECIEPETQTLRRNRRRVVEGEAGDAVAMMMVMAVIRV